MYDDNGNEIQFIVPNEMTTIVKLVGKLSMLDVVVIVLLVSFCLNMIPKLVYAPLKIPAMIFVGLIAWFWISPSATNPQKRNYQRLLYVFMRDKQSYHPIPYYTAETILFQAEKE